MGVAVSGVVTTRCGSYCEEKVHTMAREGVQQEGTGET